LLNESVSNISTTTIAKHCVIDNASYVAVSGLWPSFLQHDSDSSRQRFLDVNLVDHFVSAQHDGSMITWAHAVNSRERLKHALMSRLISVTY